MRHVRILILGGDGYLGWPTRCTCRRAATKSPWSTISAGGSGISERGTDTLTPIVSLQDRVEAWREASGKRDPRRGRRHHGLRFLSGVVRDFKPEAIVHYGEQRLGAHSR